MVKTIYTIDSVYNSKTQGSCLNYYYRRLEYFKEMVSPGKNKIASRYLDLINDSSDSGLQQPLQPTLRYNSPRGNKMGGGQREEDLETLAKQLNVRQASPSKAELIRSKFESPSVTVSSFKSPHTKANTTEKTPSRPTYDTPSGPRVRSEVPTLNYNTNSPTLSRFSSPTNNTSKDSPGYEYLCRIMAIKNWLQIVLQETIEQEPVELITYVRNGIYLAKLANLILPTKKAVFTNDSKLQFRHTENINRFFKLIDYLNIPDVFRFELTDLYDAKNVPKVWFCLHAMSYMLNKIESTFPQMENLVNKIEFTDNDIKIANRSLIGTGLPNFASADTDTTSSLGAGESSYMNRTLALNTLLQPKKKENVVSKSKVDNPFLDDSSEYSSIIPSNVTSKPSRPLSLETSQDRLADLDNFTTRFDKNDNGCSSKASYKIFDDGLKETIIDIVKLQALARGASFRYRLFVDRIMLKSLSDEFTGFFSIIRGNMSRQKSIHKHRAELMDYKHLVVSLQSIIRANTIRKETNFDFSASSSKVSELQTIARAYMVRRKLTAQRSMLATFHESVVLLQSIARGKLIRPKVTILMSNKDDIEPIVFRFQSTARGAMVRKDMKVIKDKLHGEPFIVKLQAAIRRGAIFGDIKEKRNNVSLYLHQICEIQSIGRGGITRTKLCDNVLLTLLDQDVVLSQLYGKVRGSNLRRQIQEKKKLLLVHENSSIVPIQTLFRGILCRFEKEVKLDDLYNEIGSVISLQSIVRGMRTRKSFKSMKKYYISNKDKVIKVQAYVRSSFAQRAYKSLIKTKNPPLSVIQNFAYLLSDNETDYQEEIELAELKNKIIETARTNEELEAQIENLDIKLSLLDKNKITAEELIKNQSKFKTYRPNTSGKSFSAAIEKLNKSARERIELYQSMFYFLQTKPAYLIRLYQQVSVNNKEAKLCQDLFACVTLMFSSKETSLSSRSREEFFFLKFVFSMMKNDMETNCHSISDLTKVQSCFWIDFFLHFNNHSKQRIHLKSLLGKMISAVTEDETVDFESDPVEIYHSMIQKEIKVQGYTDKPTEVTAQTALKEDLMVPEIFVQNLTSLREYATDILNLLEQSVSLIPIHVRLVAQHSYELSQIQFPDKTEQQHLAVAGVVFIKHYISAILQYPENFGYFTKYPNNDPVYVKKGKNNLRHLNRVLLQLFSMRQFSDNFLKPFNSYITSMTRTVEELIMRIIDVKSIDEEYELNDYDDLVTHERPSLTMKVSDMIMMEEISNQYVEVMAPSSDDQLSSILSKLNDISNSATDFVTLTELGSVTLHLNPTTKEESLADSKVETLFAQAKRCILYIIRVQEGNSLLELLISGINLEHDAKFKEIVKAEKEENAISKLNEKRRPYYKTSLGDLSLLSYRELKKKALEILLQLESMGYLTRKNSYQDVLNQIAVDIKTKHYQRVSRKSQLDTSIRVAEKLDNKKKFLSRQLADYNSHIDEVLANLQLKPKDKKLFNIIPIFSKQYFYHRELKKSNRLPKFGSYKYSAKKLIDQEILEDFGGVLSQRAATNSKLDIMFSCHEAGKFVIEAAGGSVNIPGAYSAITLDELLSLQYENKTKLELFDGMAIFNAQNLSSFIFKKFYDVKKD